MLSNEVWAAVSFSGSPETGLVLVGLLFVVWLWLRQSAKRPQLKAFVFVYGVSLVAFLLIALLIKIAWPVARACIPCPSPDCNPWCPDDASFPSGHTGTAFVLATAAALVTRKKLALIIFAYSTLIALSRLALGVHTLLDVLAGAGFGLAITLAVFYSFKSRTL